MFDALCEQGVALEAMLLKPNMVIPGEDCSAPASVEEVATATLRCLAATFPPRCPGSSSCPAANDRLATAHLNAINRLPAEALENQLLLRASASGSGAGGLAWAGRKPAAGREALRAGALQRRGQSRGLHGRDGGDSMAKR